MNRYDHNSVVITSDFTDPVQNEIALIAVLIQEPHTYIHKHSSRILGFFVADQRHLLEFWGGWSSRLEAAVPVKTHSGGTAHLGGHASHANLAQFTHWGQTRTR